MKEIRLKINLEERIKSQCRNIRGHHRGRGSVMRRFVRHGLKHGYITLGSGFGRTVTIAQLNVS